VQLKIATGGKSDGNKRTKTLVLWRHKGKQFRRIEVLKHIDNTTQNGRQWAR
jgi:hypothetical protein